MPQTNADDPRPASTIKRIAKAVKPFGYDRVYGAFWEHGDLARWEDGREEVGGKVCDGNGKFSRRMAFFVRREPDSAFSAPPAMIAWLNMAVTNTAPIPLALITEPAKNPCWK